MKDVCGFFFRGQPSYSPSPEIEAFLRNESKPIYIGFGSIVMDDPAAMTTIIQAACRQAGVRVIVSRGWSKLGMDCKDPNLLFIGDCPHGARLRSERPTVCN
jgi:UDP:flavonoid glycosyltransferase YjiC (YdhE family)